MGCNKLDINDEKILMKKYQSYIDGKWMDSLSKETIKVDDPATAKTIGEVACAKKRRC